MNILWVEDFGGGLDTGKMTLKSFFGDLMNFDLWDNDELDLLAYPNQLEEFCRCTSTQNVHLIFLCRNYFDYNEFNKINIINNKIDTIIIDVRLDNNVNFVEEIPVSYKNNNFHENAGFYIYNNLIYFGFPAERICFMTGEKSTVQEFDEKCNELYIQKPIVFEKSDKEYTKLRNWLTEQESDYIKLRRGIITGCIELSEKLQFNQDLPFNRFIEKEEKIITIGDMRNYLDTLKNFLPLRLPNNEKDKSNLYKLFIRTLTHEWEAAEPKKIIGLPWIMKNIRNWIVHNSNLFDTLDEKIVTYLFIINMRLMFSLDDKVQSYEKILLHLFDNESLLKEQFISQTTPINITYLNLKKKLFDEKANYVFIKDGFYFNELANNIQESKSLLRNDKKLFMKIIYQMFWLLNSYPFVAPKGNLLEIKFNRFDYTKNDYLIELARHIYNSSFP